MKRLILTFILLTIFQTVCFAEDSDRLSFVCDSNQGMYYFDNQTVKYGRNETGMVTDSIIDCWIQLEYNEKGKNEEIKYRNKNNLSTEGFQNLSSSFIHYQYRKNNRESAIVEMVWYDKEGNSIASFRADWLEWNTLIPNTTGEYIFLKVLNYANNHQNLMYERSVN